MKDEQIIRFIKEHPDLRNDYRVEHNTIVATITSDHFSDRKFYESLINGFDNYFAITGKYLVIYKKN